MRATGRSRPSRSSPRERKRPERRTLGVLRRLFVVSFCAAIAVALAATPAWGKEGVEATLQTSLPPNASPGDQLRVAWTLAYRDEQGKWRPFGASGVFIRLVSASGGKPTTAVSGDGGRTGAYEATVSVPEGGIGGISIGLHGTSSGAGGTSAADLYFPVRNSPVPVVMESAPAPSVPTPAARSADGFSALWIAALALTSLLAASGLAIVLRNRRRLSALGARRP
jgi:hypothetical protein